MHAPVRGASTATNEIEIDWSELTAPDNGDAEVTSYSLEWDAGTDGSSWVSLAGYLSSYLDTTYLVTDNVIEGKSYRFRLRAKNVWGWGAYSSETTVKAAREPAQMTHVATSVDAATGDLVISWQEPNIQGDAITEYLVEIADAAQAQWTEYTPTCDGADPTLLSCQVAMSVLEADPYSYQQGEMVIARITAYNSYGAGLVSTANSDGALLRTKPH
jgi:hypothetical protein